MPSAPIIVYDKNMGKRAYLQNAFDIGYSQPVNGLWTAQFTLPAADPKNAECSPLNFVEVFDDNERIELFRIIPNTLQRSADGSTVTYHCEHVLATLLNDVLFQFHTIGNLGIYTEDVIEYILSKQLTQRWVVGDIQFSRQFEYNWENETLLAALNSVPKPFIEDYQWSYDTTVYPWRLSLVEPQEAVKSYIRYGSNMQGMTKEVDPTAICNRLYGLGYGEGVNQLTFAEINGGLPYIEDTASQALYGVISGVFVDRRFEYPETLLARCEALLKELSIPRIVYTATASDIHKLTGEQIYKFTSGSIARIKDDELGEDVTVRIVNKIKKNIKGQPGEVELVFANKPMDLADDIARLQERLRVNDTYAQGATSSINHDYADNCDAAYPAIMRFWLPEETVRVNKMRLTFQTQRFRAYSRAIQGGGAISKSSEASSSQTTEIAPATSSGPSSAQTTASKPAESSPPGVWSYVSYPLAPDFMDFAGAHNHGIPGGTQIALAGGGSITWVAASGHAHQMYSVYHTHTIPAHNHDMPHTHQIPAHFHEMPHTHQIILPAHTHGIEHGIFEAPGLPSSIEVKVDGQMVQGVGTNVSDLDIVPYLEKDDSGRVKRGVWHTVEITPNSIGRIVANIFGQIFMQSRGGGDF